MAAARFRPSLNEMNEAIEAEGAFSIKPDSLYYYDDDEIVCTGTVQLSPFHSIQKIEAVLQSTVIYTKRSTNKKTKRPVFRIRVSIPELDMESLSLQPFEVRVKVPMFTPPTVHSKGTFHISQRIVRIDAFVRWSLELVGFYPQENLLTLSGPSSRRARSATTTTLDRDFRSGETATLMEPVPEVLTLGEGGGENEHENENGEIGADGILVTESESTEQDAENEERRREDAAALGTSLEQEPRLILLARTKINKRSLYEKTAGEVTVEGSTRGTIVKQLKGETKDMPSVEHDDVLADTEMGEISDEGLGEPEEPRPSVVENVASKTFQPATKADLQFMYEAQDNSLTSYQSAGSSNSDKHGAISLEHPEEQARADREREIAATELDAILQTDYEIGDDKSDVHKKVFIMRATLTQSTTLCNKEPFEIKVSLLNETKTIIARSIEASLVQVNSYFLSGRRLRQSTTVASDKIKLSKFKTKSLYTHTLTIDPACKRLAKDLENFASDGYNGVIPAPTASVTGVKGYSLLVVDYKVVITVKVWGGDDIVKTIAVDLESVAERPGRSDRYLDSQRLPVPQRDSVNPSLLAGNNSSGAQEVVDDDNTVYDGFADAGSSTSNLTAVHANASCSNLNSDTSSGPFTPDRRGGRQRSNSTSPRVGPVPVSLGVGSSQSVERIQSNLSLRFGTLTAPLRISSPALSAANTPPQYGEIGSKSTKSYGNLERRRQSSADRRGSVSVSDSMLNDNGETPGTRRRSRQGSVGARGIRRLSKAITPLLGINGSSGNITVPPEFTRSENDVAQDSQTPNTSLHDLAEGIDEGSDIPKKKKSSRRGTFNVGTLRRLSKAILPVPNTTDSSEGTEVSEQKASAGKKNTSTGSTDDVTSINAGGNHVNSLPKTTSGVLLQINDNNAGISDDDGLPAYSQVVN
ncbi:hypothetical protein SARC_01172 [Sphaeroforma arctica JP610]|uniref:Uncharacterized protein n=1 Tax=Sphaeroforma arctica JP610 TaxID=667725 RepID=A0A0L0GCT9_9EUKA|nr:hypothetical protein SARC_01172 [Sphaeroforma arctica JP610]KNC86706.1 hypothetical protein SARC_01172 [Sphaeroforma arctica JP610]|eukprot:XP_014160608.1 hypothetical protein SARC_01172 [Sphaeroforma arctica JP610]